MAGLTRNRFFWTVVSDGVVARARGQNCKDDEDTTAPQLSIRYDQDFGLITQLLRGSRRRCRWRANARAELLLRSCDVNVTKERADFFRGADLQIGKTAHLGSQSAIQYVILRTLAGKATYFGLNFSPDLCSKFRARAGK